MPLNKDAPHFWNLPRDVFYSNRSIILKHWGRDKINNISLTTFLKVFFFFNESAWISKKKLLKFVGTINNIVALVQIISWCRPSDTLLFEPLIVSLPTHICVIRPQWIYSAYLQTVAYWNVSCLCLKHSIFKMKAGAFYFHVFIKKFICTKPSTRPFCQKMFPWCKAVIVCLLGFRNNDRFNQTADCLENFNTFFHSCVPILE